MTGKPRPDWLRAILRPEPPPDDTDPEPTPVSFDGGTRTTMPAPAPSMSERIRRARFGNVAGLHQPPDDDAA